MEKKGRERHRGERMNGLIKVEGTKIHCDYCGKNYPINELTKDLVGLCCSECGCLMVTEYDYQEALRIKRMVKILKVVLFPLWVLDRTLGFLFRRKSKKKKITVSTTGEVIKDENK
jgi:hypothetical protein